MLHLRKLVNTCLIGNSIESRNDSESAAVGWVNSEGFNRSDDNTS